MSPEQGKPSLFRRIGRKGLRFFRPLALPVFNRFQARFQLAVEQSSIPRRLEVIESAQHAIASSLAGAIESARASSASDSAALIARLAVIESAQHALGLNLASHAGDTAASIASLAAHAGNTAASISSLAGLVEATRSSHVADAIAFNGKFEGMQVALQRLQTGADAMRLDLIEFTKATASEVPDQGKAAAPAASAFAESIAAAIAAIAAVAAEAVRHRESAEAIAATAAIANQQVVERLDALARSIADAGQHEAAAVAAQRILSRLDLIVQRSALSLGSDALLHTPSGFLLVPTEDRTLLSAVWESGGKLEPGTIRVLTSLLREGDHAIDVGSHIGLTVLPAARKVGPSGRVLAFEPVSRVATLLKQSMALNFVTDRVVVHQCAAGAVEGKARMHLSSILGESSLLDVPGSSATEEVEVRTVDSLVSPGQVIRLAKIDAEGFESHVWQGMRRVVDENPGLVVIVEFGPTHLARAGLDVEDWLRQFTALGFKPMEIDELSGVIGPLRDIPSLRQVGSLNLLLLRQAPRDFPELDFE